MMRFIILSQISVLSVKGFHEEPQCAAVCPVDCCIPDLNNIESESLLLEKQKLMHSDEINA